jgi:hypothetical protein
MKDLTIIALDSKSSYEAINKESGSFFEPLSSIRRQLNSHEISYNIIRTSVDRIPNSVQSNLVMFVDNSFLVKEDYIFNAVTLNNLHRDMGIIFGPTSIHTKSNKCVNYIKNSYHPHNYGSLYNAVISGSVYNRIGFSGCKTTRSFILDNSVFFKEVAKYNKIYYSSVLCKVKTLTEEDFNHEVISDYYYDLGYLDGVSSSALSSIEKRDDLWKRFVEAPEVIDCNHPRWLFEESKDENCDYLELLVLLKCKYQIGYFEGMLGKRVI